MPPDPTDAPSDATEHENLIGLRMAAIDARFPDRFSPDQVTEIRRRVARSVALGATLADVHLPNWVGPGFDPRAVSHE